MESLLQLSLDLPGTAVLFDSPASSLPNSSQSSPNNSTGCCARSEPLPQHMESAGQYLSQPQQIRSGCAGCIGNFLAMSHHYSDTNRIIACCSVNHDFGPNDCFPGILNFPCRLNSSSRCKPAIFFTSLSPSGVRYICTSRLSAVPRCRYINPSFSQREASYTTPLCGVCNRSASSPIVAHSRSLYPLT